MQTVGKRVKMESWCEKMMTLCRSLVRKSEGQGLLEYVLIISLIAIVLIASLTSLGTAIQNIPLSAVVAAL